MAHPPIAPQTEVRAAPRRTAVIADVRIAFVWRTLIVLAAIAGILQLSLPSSFIFFTVQSNAILVAVVGYELIAMARHKSPLPLPIKGAATLYILITGLVYNIILAPTVHVAPGTVTVPIIGRTPSNVLLHIVTPTLALLDWLLFETHTALRWRTALLWLAYLFGYLGFVLIRGLLIDASLVSSNGTRYPYPFVNVDRIGYGGVAVNTALYASAFWLLGLVLIALNQWLARRTARSLIVA